MNEEQKHIESCRAEDPLAQTMEACGNESDIQAALQPLLVETMPGYEPVPTTAPTSPIAELPNVLISIIRRVATKPLAILGERPAKQSLLGTLLDTWNAIRQRLAGNPSAGIPDRRADMSGHSLPTALALLSDRKITNGGSTTDGIPDGMSLARLLCDTSAANSVTEIVDDNYGYTMDKAPSNAFPNAKKVTIGCKTLHAAPSAMYPNAEEFNFPDLDHIDTSETGHPQTNLFYGSSIKRIGMKNVKRFYVVNASYNGVFYNLTGHCEIDLSGCTYMDAREGGDYPVGFHTITGVWKIVLGTCTRCHVLTSASNALSLIHFEIGQDTACNINNGYWSPTNALDASRTDLVEQGSEAENNLQQFLLNFRDYIALRLADNGSGLTLTLSQAVYDTIKDESHLFVFDEGTMTIYAYLTNIKHWTVTK